MSDPQLPPQITYVLDATHETADLGVWFLTEIHTIPGRVRRAESWHIYAARGLVTAATGAIGPVSFGWGPADPKAALVLVAEAKVETPSSTSIMHGDDAYVWDSALAREQIEAEVARQKDRLPGRQGRNMRRRLADAGLLPGFATREHVDALLLACPDLDLQSFLGMKARPHVMQAHAAVCGLVSIIAPTTLALDPE